MSEPTPVTKLLHLVNENDHSAREELLNLVYQELHAIACEQMNREEPGRTLQPTALVNEAYCRLFGSENAIFENRRHFFSAAAKTMRDIRVDDARRRRRMKRGAGQPCELVEDPPTFDQDPAEVLAIHEALEGLERKSVRKAEVVMLRYFAGMTIEECAAALEVSPRTVNTDWQFAKAWLHRVLSDVDASENDDEFGKH